MKNRTASVEPWERARPMDAHIGDPPQNLGLRSPSQVKIHPLPRKSEANRRAIRFTGTQKPSD